MVPRISDEDVLDDIHRMAEDLDRTPSCTDVMNHGSYALKTYTERFGGGIDEALEAAGLDPGEKLRRNGGIEDHELVEEIEWISEMLGRRPTQSDIREHSQFSIGTYYNHFDSLMEPIRKANLY